MLQHLWWSFSFFHFSDHFYQISCGKSEGEGAVTHTVFSTRHNTLGLLTTQEQASWGLIDSSPFHHCFNIFSLKFMWFCSTFSTHTVQWGAVQDAFFTPWSLKAVRKLHADFYHHKAPCSHTPDFSHSLWHSAPRTAHLSVCITGITATVNGIKTTLP